MSDSAARLLEALEGRGMTVAVAESLTGGLVCAAITAVPGASRCFLGGIVAYAAPAKADVLGVPTSVLAMHGTVAAQTAQAMALAVRDRFGAQLGLATTGAAGPGWVGEHPPGTVFVAAAGPLPAVLVRHAELSGTRDDVRAATVELALAAGLEALGAR